jgi:RecQ family ATP-dependent DNA helicase
MPSSRPTDLHAVLRQRFGHEGFRAGQEEVCRAVASGKDALLVMPTGAGKSLCYQLPGLARGGTTLVISPLIALMEDQVAKLLSLGARVERIHSGLSREQSRQACRGYLDGTLDFLFIAPERLRVPSFVPMLARRKPGLIAVDEAHCISQWGHDFRADYRTLGQHLAVLRPSPVIALTATATPQVQQDILTQLNLEHAERFIHGFRRDNLAIEVAEVPRPQRLDLMLRLLKDAERRPAIVYTFSRKDSEATATTLAKHFRAAAYHAGMAAEDRSRVQTQFLAGKIEVVVATIAFGMGVDKADVRTVIHSAFPATLEAYYQEIGRAGRDGLPSRAVLMHSYADQKMQEFFLEQDYPPAEEVAKVHGKLTSEPVSLETLQRGTRLDERVVASAVERMAAHGGAVVELDGSVTRGQSDWRPGYNKHVAMRRAQMQGVVRFTQANGCRMAMLVLHFGDVEDARIDCGECDWCNPKESLLQTGREATDSEHNLLREILAVLQQRKEMSVGKLQQEIPAAMRLSRSDWNALLAAGARAGLLFCEDATFVQGGETVTYRKISATFAGSRMSSLTALPELIVCSGQSARAERSEVPTVKKPLPANDKKALQEREKARWSAPQHALERALREWRSAQAQTLKQPAFFIFSDALLHSLVKEAPTDVTMLREIAGFGPAKVNRFGADICRMCTEHLLHSA